MIDGREYNSLEDYVKYFNSTSSDGATLDASVPYYGGIKVPAKDYGSGSASIVLILFAFFVDSLAIAGIYIQYKVKSEMLIPWLLFYALLIPGLLGAGVANAILQESVTNKYYSIVPVC